MLNTYIKNKGTTQTLINNNNQKLFNQISWDAEYDGETANVSLTTNTNGDKNHFMKFTAKLDNEDLANILNIPSISKPIHKRLQMDFNDRSLREKPYYLKPPIVIPRKPSFEPNTYSKSDDETIQELLQSIKPTNYISSPMPNEELILPISIDDKTINNLTLTPNKRHKRPKTHKTYRVYKKLKSSSPKKYKPKKVSLKKSKSKFKSKFKSKSKSSKLDLY
jgi:hypothetical protein